MQDTQTLADFIAEHEITMDVEGADSNPNATSDDQWQRDARHFLCTLRSGDETMRVPFSQGSAHTQDPTADDVLDCLASDAASVENAADWIDWAEGMGMAGDADELRAARKTHETIRAQSSALRDLLGEDGYLTLLWSVERA